MKKLLKWLASIVALVVCGGAGIGFLADARFASRHEVVIDAPIGKVWDVVSEPNRVPEWLPPEPGGMGVAEVREAGLVEMAARALERSSKGEARKSYGRHTYVTPEKKTITVEVVERESRRRLVEHVTATDTFLDDLFSDLSWGFELSEAGEGRTRLTVLDEGTARRPAGVLLVKAGEWTGMRRREKEKIARNVEAVAQGKKLY